MSLRVQLLPLSQRELQVGVVEKREELRWAELGPKRPGAVVDPDGVVVRDKTRMRGDSP